MSEPTQVDKQLVRRSFDKAAPTYDAHAVLQREIGQRMLERLGYIKYQPLRILDVGAGTGQGTRGLRAQYPQAQVLALDLAEAMLKIACPQPSLWQKLRHHAALAVPVCGDMDALPFKAASMDMIWSSLALQWSNDLTHNFAEFHRVLSPGGLLMFSTFGPDTLKELRAAFSTVDGYQHVNKFIDMHDIGDWLMQAGFAAPVMDMEFITLTYADVRAMMHELKAIGAHNVTAGRNPGLTGRAQWRRLEAAMELFRQHGRLPLTWEVIYGHAWRNTTQPRHTDTVQPITWHRHDMASNER